jgi:aminoglycoside phosphotransferase (APT) family kinase protein
VEALVTSENETDAQSAAIVRWLDRELGAEAVSIDRQSRWRPVWIVDADAAGERLQLMVRGERSDSGLVFPLAHEMRFQQQAHTEGIPTPQVYGWIEELPAYVMGRAAGRPDFAGVPDADRERIVDEYLDVLAALHQLDVEPFARADIVRAAHPSDSAMIGMQRFEALFRAQKRHPDPFMEFCLGWFHRHPPRSLGREAAVVWDSGQFHHDHGHLVAVLDVELGHIGDPMMDLAGWRMRSSIIPFGDFNAIYQRYEALTGRPVDMEAIQLHHFAFTLSNQLSFSHALKDPPPGSDYATNLQWCNETNLYATEALAEYLGVDLPDVDGLEPADSPTAPVFAHLVRSLREMSTDDIYLGHQIRIDFRLARHLQRRDEIGMAALEANLGDLTELLGHRPSDWRSAERELEDFVRADIPDGRHTEQLIMLFHKRNLRAQMLNGPVGSAMARHNPIQGFSR